MKPQNVEEYIDIYPDDQRAKLTELRKILRDALPDTSETLKWGNPALLEKDGMILAIYAGYKQHMNLVVTPSAKDAFNDKLENYVTGKGSFQMQYDKPLPAQLIQEIVLYRANEYRENNVKWM